MYSFLAAQKLKVFRLMEISKSAKDFPFANRLKMEIIHM